MKGHEGTTAATISSPSAKELVACWGDEHARFELAAGTLLVGRGEACDVLLPHPSVSRRHAQLDVGPHGIVLEDLGSANGVQIDGEPVAAGGRAPLPLGAIVTLGAIRLVVRLKEPVSPSPMIEVRRLVEKVAPSPVSVIVLGETGVGKEVLTEGIHARSGRSGPLVRVNCAGLSTTLLESELFGYERGAFTGAVQAKVGLIESAQGGTLFLDELGEMPEATQPKLLRVLESREVQRIGAVRSKPVDVRFIAATHRDLRTLAVMGKFREDLLFRLNGVALRMPPLRERRDEIRPLAETFLREAYAPSGHPAPRLSEGAHVLLESYRWPGNVRELRNVVHRVAFLCDGDVVRVEHLDFGALPGAAPSCAPPSIAPPSIAPPSGSERLSALTLPLATPEATMETGERERIVQALAKAGGNQAAAAKTLGMTARVLAYRMDKLGLPRPRRG